MIRGLLLRHRCGSLYNRTEPDAEGSLNIRIHPVVIDAYDLIHIPRTGTA